VLVLRVVAGIAAAIISGPASLLPPAPLPLLVVRLAFEGAADLVAAFGLLAELAFLVAAAVDDREGLPPPAPRGARAVPRPAPAGPSR
jgi:hypothetical protein